jgi:hypothetical protein
VEFGAGKGQRITVGVRGVIGGDGQRRRVDGQMA